MSNCYIEMIVGFVGRGGSHTVITGRKGACSVLVGIPVSEGLARSSFALGKIPHPFRKGFQSCPKRTPVLFEGNSSPFRTGLAFPSKRAVCPLEVLNG